MNTKARLEKFNKEYTFLYDHGDRVAGYDEALDRGEMLIAIMHPVVVDLLHLRQDCFVSDREVAALGFACEDIWIPNNLRI